MSKTIYVHTTSHDKISSKYFINSKILCIFMHMWHKNQDLQITHVFEVLFLRFLLRPPKNIRC
jgi:hypothetical protein